MPFSSMTDLAELARASAALEAAWNEIRLTLPNPFDERNRTRIAYIVASLVGVAEDEDDLTRRVIGYSDYRVGSLLPQAFDGEAVE